MSIFEVKHLNKCFTAPGGIAKHAVNNLSFSVDQGQCFGLLGPNGAGKTTALEILEGLQAADSGEIFFRNQWVNRLPYESLGVLFQQTALPDLLTVRECLQMFQGLYAANTSSKKTTADFDTLVESCTLNDFLHLNHRALSGGQRQRLLLALALIHDPDIVFLDEPTTGLDPQARQNFWRLVENLKARGKTIVLTTHYMEEAQRLCNRIAIIDHGRIIANDSPDSLLGQHFRGYLFRLPENPSTCDSVRQLYNVTNYQFTNLPFTNNGSEIEFEVEEIETAIDTLKRSGTALERLQIRSPNLEDLFLKLTGHALRD